MEGIELIKQRQFALYPRQEHALYKTKWGNFPTEINRVKSILPRQNGIDKDPLEGTKYDTDKGQSTAQGVEF